MAVPYNRTLAIVMLVIGGVSLLMALLLLALGNANVAIVIPNIISGVFLLTIGNQYRTKTYFSIEGNQVVIQAALGGKTATHAFTKLMIEKNTVFIEHNGTKTKLPLSRSVSDPAAWQALEAKYGAR
jgi:hypothetical protein